MSYNFDSLYNKLKQAMTINGKVDERFIHSIGVMEMALKINAYYNLGLDSEKLKIAGFLHDCAKFYSKNEMVDMILAHENKKSKEELLRVPQILHGFAGKYVAQSVYGIHDEIILDAIYYHTVGKVNMNPYEEVIFVSDYIEENRVGECFDVAREAVFKDLHYGTYTILKQTFDYLKNSGKMIDEDLVLGLDFYKQYERKQ